MSWTAAGQYHSQRAHYLLDKTLCRQPSEISAWFLQIYPVQGKPGITAAARQCSPLFWPRSGSFNFAGAIAGRHQRTSSLPRYCGQGRRDAKLQFDQEESNAGSRRLAAALVGPSPSQGSASIASE
jgi:hypothetical protein